MSVTDLHRITVVGCGLVGGSFALAARAVPGVEQVTVTDTDVGTLERARERGIADVVEADPHAAVAGADLVVLAIPIPAITQVAAELASSLAMHTILTDVGSVKSQVVREVEGSLPRGIAYIGGHPMAGSERSGVDAADGTLFQGSTYLLTPTARVTQVELARLTALLRGLGARVLAIAPELHDRLVAVVSHLPQVLASVLMSHAAEAAEERGAVLALTAGGFRDVTRVAASDPDLWVGILRENRVAVLDELTAYGARLDRLRALLAGDDEAALRAYLAAAREARRSLPGKAAAEAILDLVVPVPDRPGALAEVTTALGEAGVNIEDLAMRHASEGARGAMVIAIAGAEAAHRAQEVLATRGLPSHVEPR